MIVRSCFLKYMIDRNCNKLGCMSQVLKSFKQGWVKRVARINPSATK